MRGFHVNWTRPFAVRAPGMPYAVEPFELLTTALSALFWRRENGSICMVCDSRAAEYYASLGLDFLWDDGMHPLLDAMPDDINATAFWAAGKLYAVAAMKARTPPPSTARTSFRPFIPENPPFPARTALISTLSTGACSRSTPRCAAFQTMISAGSMQIPPSASCALRRRRTTR